MNGATLRFLSGVADIARLDLEAAAVTLRSQGGELQAIYAGAYARGVRYAQADVPDFSISVNAGRFKVLASMFLEEDTVAVRHLGTRLGLSSKTSQASLQQWGEESDPPAFDRDNVEFVARLKAATFIGEIEAAQEFTAESVLRPALTGIRLDFQDKLRVTAFDGFGALYESEVSAKIRGEGAMIVPTADFVLGARLIADGDIIVVKPKGQQAAILYNSKALFRSSLIALPWPETSSIQRFDQQTQFKVEAFQIRNLVAGAKALESGPDIEVKAQKGHVLFSAESEAGAFTTAVKGALNAPLRFDAATLAKVTRLGPVLDFFVPDSPNLATRVESEHRKAWIMTRA